MLSNINHQPTTAFPLSPGPSLARRNEEVLPKMREPCKCERSRISLFDAFWLKLVPETPTSSNHTFFARSATSLPYPFTPHVVAAILSCWLKMGLRGCLAAMGMVRSEFHQGLRGRSTSRRTRQLGCCLLNWELMRAQSLCTRHAGGTIRCWLEAMEMYGRRGQIILDR